jgi:hypothetical protein
VQFIITPLKPIDPVCAQDNASHVKYKIVNLTFVEGFCNGHLKFNSVNYHHFLFTGKILLCFVCLSPCGMPTDPVAQCLTRNLEYGLTISE